MGEGGAHDHFGLAGLAEALAESGEIGFVALDDAVDEKEDGFSHGHAHRERIVGRSPCRYHEQSARSRQAWPPPCETECRSLTIRQQAADGAIGNP